ncbi:GNAT family N-acetyltransferase [Nocardioides massiliensis]|uniref:Ribosomal protein S18 acetylase RimI-like enzyme n=1 Tax=Nocardioides massiliensis TaxID=1325935 RepID=A0ABT9NRZ4_9ACTN|nr:GNAT family N-acetyltransferase [Nocardioides massiliensis]MDP9823189.1 ribosomal protein S18 acetylase RimI-like enzyme [Nocardioides massiliensis]
MIALRPIPAERLGDWQRRSLAAYADGLRSSGLGAGEIGQHVVDSAQLLFPNGRLRAGHEVFDVLVDDEVCGYLWVGPSLWGDDFYVYDVAVDEHARGRGVGRAVMETVEEMARERGHRSVGLTVTDANVAARGMYELLGYVEVEAVQGRGFLRKVL